MRVAYFVHDAADPAVARRVSMLKAAGAEVAIVGFRRSDQIRHEVEQSPVFDLGRTHDSRLAQRALMVLQRRSSLGAAASNAVRGADLLLARNLEMLAIAAAAQSRDAPKAVLAYECLDLHRLVLANSLSGSLLRLIERALMRRASLLMVSSPAFISRYFAPRQGVGTAWDHQVLVIENKLLDLSGAESGTGDHSQPAPGPPWRIGWFGMIRCQRSLDLLCNLASHNPGVVEVVIRGRPARVAFDDFDAQVARTPGVTFTGPYEAADLPAHYGGVHFNWAIDYFEDGGNSALLLPNRIYEGSAYGAVPLALSRTETGRWLQRRRLGVLLDSPVDELAPFLRQLASTGYSQLRQTLQAEPRRSFIADREDCDVLLNALVFAANTREGQGKRPRSSEFGPVRPINRA